jgi:apolipoprotein N-acyltransferase
LIDLAALITLLVGFVFFLIGTIWVYSEAGSIANKFGLVYSIGALFTALPLVLLAAYESTVLTETLSPTSIPVYVPIFAAELAGFFILLWRWLRLIRKVGSMRFAAEGLQTNVDDATQKLENLSQQLTQYGESISTVIKDTKSRDEEKKEITKIPK